MLCSMKRSLVDWEQKIGFYIFLQYNIEIVFNSVFIISSFNFLLKNYDLFYGIEKKYIFIDSSLY